MTWIEEAKHRAAEMAVNQVSSGFIVGLGSGSTTAYAIRKLGDKLKHGELKDVLGVPTSLQAVEEAVYSGVPLTTLEEYPEPDLTIDGADQIDRALNVIKGGGAALLREKVLASVSKNYIIVADEKKLVDVLGVGCKLPIEVIPFAMKPVLLKIKALGAEAIVRSSAGKVGPLVTENGNIIIDANFGEISDLKGLESKLKSLPGIVETGLFLGYTDIAYIGMENRVKKLVAN